MERDPSFVFNGAYTPAVCRIVSAVAAAANSPNPDAASADLKNLVPGHKVGNERELELSNRVRLLVRGLVKFQCAVA